MLGGLSVPESAAEILSLVNCSRNSLFPAWRKPSAVAAPRREKQRRIAARSALSDGGGIVVVDDEFKFTPSFSEYLKAMEFLKTDRDNTDNTNGGSYNSPRRKKFVKKNVREDENSSDEVAAVREDSRKGKRGAIYEEDSRNGDFRGAEMVDRKEHRDWKNGNRKRSDGSESESSDGERAAFKPLEFDDDVVGKPRVTRVDMEERIQKLAKCLNGADVDMPEWKFSEMMRSAQIRFSDHSILRIVQILGKFGNWKRVLQVIEWLQSRERFKSHRTRYIYTAALDALGKARRPVEALNFFYRMQVLSACVQRKKWEGSFWVLQQLSQQGQQPSCTTYGLVMEVMLACGKYDFVHGFFKKVQKSYIPNVKTNLS